MLGGSPAFGRYLEDEFELDEDGSQSAVSRQSAGEAVGRNRPTALQRVAKRDYSRYSASKKSARNLKPVSTD
jgi:hypothetical protein